MLADHVIDPGRRDAIEDTVLAIENNPGGCDVGPQLTIFRQLPLIGRIDVTARSEVINTGN